MSTLEQAVPAGHQSKGRLGLILTAAGLLVVVAVVVVFLTLPGSSRTSTATHPTATHSTATLHGLTPISPPLIHYRWTDAPPPSPPAVHAPRFRFTVPPLLPHERSYGAVP